MTAYAGGAMRLSVNSSNFVPSPKIAWNYRGKAPITPQDVRFTVLPSGVLQVHSLSSADTGKIRAVASTSSGTKANEIVTGQFQEITIEAGMML